MDLARRILSRPIVFEILGKLLLSIGIVLACTLAAHFTREKMDEKIVEQANYLLIASTPMFSLPPATPLPTLTPTPIPTATPPPLPAIRIAIPAIELNTRIEDIYPSESSTTTGLVHLSWEPIAYAVGHYNTSGNPGEGQNIVLTGHNNMLGEVFRDLDQLSPGDQVTLFTDEKSFEYKVQKKFIVPYTGVEEEGDAALQAYASPQSSEMVTLISCWPYYTNFHRIVIIAVPVSEREENGG